MSVAKAAASATKGAARFQVSSIQMSLLTDKPNRSCRSTPSNLQEYGQQLTVGLPSTPAVPPVFLSIPNSATHRQARSIQTAMTIQLPFQQQTWRTTRIGRGM